MTLKELKENILNNTFKPSLLIMCCDSNKLIGFQYLNKIVEDNHYEICSISSIKDIYNSERQQDIFSPTEDEKCLYVLNTEELDNTHIPTDLDLSKVNRCVVICSSINKTIKNFTSQYCVTIPKLEEWQIKDYMYQKVDGLNSNIVDWLYSATKGNVDRIDIELDKLSIFPKEDRTAVFNLLYKENAFIDLVSVGIFDVVNALLKQEYAKLRVILKNLDFIEVDGVALNTLLRRNVKNIIDIQMNSRSSASSLGISPKQFNAIKFNYVGRYTDDMWTKLFIFLTDVDIRLKEGLLSLTKNQFTEYIILNTMNIMRGV